MTTEAVTTTTEETLALEEQEAKEIKSLVRTSTLLTIISITISTMISTQKGVQELGEEHHRRRQHDQHHHRNHQINNDEQQEKLTQPSTR